MPSIRTIACTCAFTLALVLAVKGTDAGLTPAPSQAALPVRFHHAHYKVGDPSAAMAEAVQKLEGTRVILQGLGVGVRAGREFLLFDRAAADDAARSGRSAAEAYPRVIEQLRAWGLRPEPLGVNHSRAAIAMGELPVDHLAFVADDFPEVVRRITSTGIEPTVQREDAVLFEQGQRFAIEILRDTDREETYWCPMHPDVRSADEGKCPLCGMALVPIPPAKIGEYGLDVTQIREPDGATTGLKVAVTEPETNRPATRFTLVHERRLHLFIISTDLQYFAHAHPDLQPDGTLTLRHRLPPGEYMVIADFLPEGGTSQMVQKAIIVPGTPEKAPVLDERHGLEVGMRVDGVLAAGRKAKLTFTVTDAKSGAPVTDLQPYLGAAAHMLLVRTDLGDAIHAHPEEQVTSGPSVSFHPIMPAAGGYKLWIQFQRGGQVSTSAFELQVTR
jgi:heavy metal-binding protein